MKVSNNHCVPTAYILCKLGFTCMILKLCQIYLNVIIKKIFFHASGPHLHACRPV